MAVMLQIQDGSPWWLSPNLWAVPGSDPEGAPGIPVAGTSCFLWAHVENTGTTAVSDAQVRFYWANPAVGFDRTTANLVGTASVTLAAGAANDVLCLTPWVPTFVNGGHECILGEVFHPAADPLPATPNFDVPTDRHVAQRNLQIVLALQARSFHASFEVHNTSRKARRFRISAVPGRPEELRGLLKTLGRKIRLDAKGEATKLGFARAPCPSDDDHKHLDAEMQLELPPNQRSGLSLVGELKGEIALVHVRQESDGKPMGGLSVLVLSNGRQEE